MNINKAVQLILSPECHRASGKKVNLLVASYIVTFPNPFSYAIPTTLSISLPFLS